jgi:hypothetical protein
MTESIQMLREQVDVLRRELRRREVADAMAKQGALERERQAAEAERRMELEKMREVELEKCREGAWYNHLLTQMIACGRGQEPFDPDDLRVPAAGWPPGDGPENYSSSGLDCAEVPTGLASDTPMARALAELLERQRMIREAKP